MNNPTFIGDAQIGNYGPIKLIKNDGSISRKRFWLNDELTKKKNKFSNEPENHLSIDTSESRSDKVSRTDSENAGQTSSSKKLDDEIDNFLRSPNDEVSMSEFKKSFLEMRNNRKWYLESGKCVENELYAFGIKCRFEQYVNSYLTGYKLRIVHNVIYI
ncbi:hypothetical protein C1646_517331 [Rhizophagus diaphanus]|nr:hypothetical protein C1646_517331 [Rhizophagus diaphanus] [Rhizophagus sp. MUCL 43196]